MLHIIRRHTFLFLHAGYAEKVYLAQLVSAQREKFLEYIKKPLWRGRRRTEPKELLVLFVKLYVSDPKSIIELITAAV